MQTIDNVKQLDALRNQHGAVVFLWVDWAIHACHSANTAAQVIDHWNRLHPDLPTVVSRINVSEQTGELWDAVTDWFAAEEVPDASGLLYGGAGPIIWIRSGRIDRYVVNASAETVDDLLENMKQAFRSPLGGPGCSQPGACGRH